MSSTPDSSPLTDVGLVLAAAGRSERFGAENKLLCELQGEPVIVKSLRKFSGIIPLAHTVVVVSPEDHSLLRDILSRHGFSLCQLIDGGCRRQESVLNGLQCLRGTVDLVLVHDAARPFIQPHTIRQCILTVREQGAAVVARRVVDTIKETDSAGQQILRTLDRQLLWAAETPQGANLEILLHALETGRRDGHTFTDEAQALETIGIPTAIVENCTPNPKLTTIVDLPIFHALADSTCAFPSVEST